MKTLLGMINCGQLLDWIQEMPQIQAGQPAPLWRWAASGIVWKTALVLVACILLHGCRASGRNAGPSIEFARIPQADERGLDKHDIIDGRVTGARPGEQIVLYARSGKWWVQPLVNQPFTRIQQSTKWFNATPLGTEYAALLVD